MATYRDIDRADQARHSALSAEAQTAEMALFLVDGLRDYMKCPEGTLVLARRKSDGERSNEVDSHLLLDGDTVRCELVLSFTRRAHDTFSFALAVTETAAGKYKAQFFGPDFSQVRAAAEVSREDTAALAALFASTSESLLSFVRFIAMD